MAEAAAKKFSVKKSFFCHSQLLSYLLNFDELLPLLLNTHTKVLSKSDLRDIQKASNSPAKNKKLLLILNDKGDDKIRKFIACLMAEPEHSGHKDLCEAIMKDLPSSERQRVNAIFRRATADFHLPNDFFNVDINSLEYQDDKCSSSDESEIESPTLSDGSKPLKHRSPPLPPPLIMPRGHLKGPSYNKIDRYLWNYFSTGRYDELSILSTRMIEKSKVLDLQIIGMWFNSLILMHRNCEYSSCISDCLQPALELCKNPNVENPEILEGRILQRMAQVYLVTNDKENAKISFHRAQECLQFVGRSYEKVNMLCRRAKILSATTPHNREEIEDAYVDALTSVHDDDSFVLASKPSLLLSKAAFHLHISFGTKLEPLSDDEPQVDEQDIQKARITLQTLPEEMLLLDMRKCEFHLLKAELERKSAGDAASARDSFLHLIENKQFQHFPNLISIAQQRIHLIDLENKKMALTDILLQDLPL